MLKQFQNKINIDFPNLGEHKIFLAISGGIDSMVLCHLLLNSNFKIQLLHCNFNLRKDESLEDQKFIENFAFKNKLVYHVQNFDTLDECKKRKTNIQETARDLRYEWFNKICINDKKSIVLTAHHLDDSIETMFINILRGTGIRGVTGIPLKTSHFYRPLLSFSRNEITEYAKQNSINFREDSSNSSVKYLRNDIRHSILPELLRIEPNLHSKISVFFEDMSDINELLEFQSSKFTSNHLNWTGSYLECQINELLVLNKTIACRVFNQYGILRSNYNEFFKFLSAESGKQFYTKNHEFVIDRDKLLFKKNKTSLFKEVIINDEAFHSKIKIENLTIERIETNPIPEMVDSLLIDFDKIQFPIKVRKWKNGDKIIPFGKSSKKLISDILINKKLSLFQKRNVLIIEDSSFNILAIIPFMISNSYKLEYNSKSSLRLSTNS